MSARDPVESVDDDVPVLHLIRTPRAARAEHPGVDHAAGVGVRGEPVRVSPGKVSLFGPAGGPFVMKKVRRRRRRRRVRGVPRHARRPPHPSQRRRPRRFQVRGRDGIQFFLDVDEGGSIVWVEDPAPLDASRQRTRGSRGSLLGPGG